MGGALGTNRKKHQEQLPADPPSSEADPKPPIPEQPTTTVVVSTTVENAIVSSVEAHPCETVVEAVPIVSPAEASVASVPDKVVPDSTDAAQSIFDRIHDWFEQSHGNSDAAASAGELAIVALVETFYRKVLADSRLYPFFQGVSMEILRRHQFEFLRNVLSKGSFKYSGKPIRIGHARLFDKGLNEQHFDMVVGHLVAAMNDIGLPTDIINDINAVVFPLRPIFEEEGKKRMVKQ